MKHQYIITTKYNNRYILYSEARWTKETILRAVKNEDTTIVYTLNNKEVIIDTKTISRIDYREEPL